MNSNSRSTGADMVSPQVSMFRLVCLVAALLLNASVTKAADEEPTIGRVMPRGIQAGGTTQLTIQGSGLGPDARILLPVPVAGVKVLEASTDNELKVQIRLDANVPCGIYFLRVVTPAGISPPAAISVDSLEQRAFSEEAGALPVALSGSIEDGTIRKVSFAGTAGQSVIVEVESKRLGSKLSPTLTVLGPRQSQIALAQPTGSLAGDARVHVTLPEDGRYTVQLHDTLYRKTRPGFFRLKIGQWSYADTVFPFVVQRGEKVALELVRGHTPLEQRGAFVAIEPLATVSAPWPSPMAVSGWRPKVFISDIPQIMEQRTSAAEPQQLPGPPIGVSGRLSVENERDVYQLPVRGGEKLRFEVTAERAGSPLDGVLSIRGQKDQQLGRGDDGAMTVDPSVELTVPEDQQLLTIMLSDLHRRGGPQFVYHLRVAPANPPQFDLSLESERTMVPANGITLTRVKANRRGYAGPIELLFHGLPDGLAVTGHVIPAGASETIVGLAAPGVDRTETIGRVTGTATETSEPIQRVAEVAEDDVNRLQPWLRNEWAVAVGGPAPLAVRWKDGDPDRSLPRGSKLMGRIEVARREGITGPVRLSLVTSQPTPRKKVKKDDKDVEVDDTVRALRLEAQPTVAPDQQETALAILVPEDLADIPFDVAIRAELLSEDGKQVASQAFSSVLRLPAQSLPPGPPRLVFEDELAFVAQLSEGEGELSLSVDDRHSGLGSAKVTPDQRHRPDLPGLSAKIRRYPVEGEYRYLRYAWKKVGGESICIQLAHDGKYGAEKKGQPTYRYHAGPGPECYGGSVAVDKKLPEEWTVVTRDLAADFGDFTLTGMALSAVDGQHAFFDHIYLGKTPADFDLIPSSSARE